MKSRHIISFAAIMFFALTSKSQGLHFSQYYNSPTLLNPANTGFIIDNDWRAGVQFRNQWATVPVPYNTFSAFADICLNKERSETGWGGIGLAFWSDKAGSAALSLNKVQISAAYHFRIAETGLLSLGLAVANASRRVDLNKITFDSQWDDAQFNPLLPNNEKISIGRSQYLDMQLGVNYAYSTDKSFIKASLSAQHINRPNESFLGQENRLGIRPLLSIDARFKSGEQFILNPSVYYTSQKRASELVFGSLVFTNLNKGGMSEYGNKNEMILGVFYRMKDALITVAGYKFNNKTITVNYDYTLSDLSKANNGNGAFEISLIIEGQKHKGYTNSRVFQCPRF